MILCIDCGNTLIKCGVYEGEKLVKNFSIDSKVTKSVNEYEIFLKTLIGGSFSIDGAIISSVVPSLTQSLFKTISNLYKVKPLLVNKNLKSQLNIKTDYPNELGADLLCGAVGAKHKYGYPVVVADLGTATKMYIIDKDGNYIGGMITAGMEVSMKSLNASTSLLMEVSLNAPKKVIGKNTKDCIQSGIVYGQAYMVSEFARRMEKELGYELKRVLTGGYSNLIKDQIVCFNFEPNLVLDGLNYIYKINKEEK